MLCVIDLCGEEEPIFVTDEAEVLPIEPPQLVPMPTLQIVPTENDES